MIVQKSTYKRNKNNDIIKREKVEIACDQCPNHWETYYEHVKRMKYNIQLCPSCRAKERWKTRKPDSHSINKECAHCSKIFSVKPYYCKETTCCSKKCSSSYFNEQKYGHLMESFDQHKDETAYLVGLIMGDGHLKKSAKNTTRVSIAFDNKKTDLIELAKDIMTSLQIAYFEEPLVHKNCKIIGFTLPDKLLSKLGILYSGDKFSSQPSPNSSIKKNINYAAGLTNSDGHVSLTKTGKEKLIFTNTVKSIVDSFCHCLDQNDIEYRRYKYDGIIDKRTGRKNKDAMSVYVEKQISVAQFRKICSFSMKEYKCN